MVPSHTHIHTHTCTYTHTHTHVHPGPSAIVYNFLARALCLSLPRSLLPLPLSLSLSPSLSSHLVLRGTITSLVLPLRWLTGPHRLYVQDTTEVGRASPHTAILSVDGDHVFSLQAKVDKRLDKARLDPDIRIAFKMNGLRVVVLKRYIDEILGFIDGLAPPPPDLGETGSVTEAPVHASTAEPAGRSSEGTAARPSPGLAVKLSISVDLKAPIIIVPLATASTRVLVADLGQITVKNALGERALSSSKQADAARLGVFDVMDVQLARFSLFFADVSKEGERRVVLRPVSLVIGVARALDLGYQHDSTPLLNVTASLPLIQVRVCVCVCFLDREARTDGASHVRSYAGIL